jgi:formate dehydrogenase major subunit
MTSERPPGCSRPRARAHSEWSRHDQVVQGTDGVSALINLALLTGNFGKPGAGVNALRGQNNVQGAAHMGCEPRTLPGGIPLDEGTSAFEALWQRSIPHSRGLHQLEMLSAASAGRLKALWAVGYDVLLSNPNAHETARALDQLDVVIIQDLFMTGRPDGSARSFCPPAPRSRKTAHS